MMNPTKFGSLNLDIPSSRYKFLKFEFISKKNKEKHLKLKSLRALGLLHPEMLTCGFRRSMVPHVSNTGVEHGV